MKFKQAPASVKNIDTDNGTFEALVSVFNNVDSYGDVVIPGAFSKTLTWWEEQGAPIPVLFSHRMDDPNYNIGHVIEASETDDGLHVKAQIDLDMPNGQLVHRQLKSGRLRQFSFAYDEIDAGPEKRDDQDVRALRELKLYEVGPTLIGANQETELLAVKSAVSAAEQLLDGVVSGRKLTTTTERELRKTYEALGTALGIVESGHAMGKANTDGPVKSDEPDGDKDDEPNRKVSAKTQAVRKLSLAQIASPQGK